MNSRITLTKNEIKHMTKVIRSLENIEISSEATTEKSISVKNKDSSVVFLVCLGKLDYH